MKQHVYTKLAASIDAWHNCKKTGNEWADKHDELISLIINRCLPHGSGIDTGVKMDYDSSHGNKLVFTFGYHFMDENGYYDGWEDYKLIVTPSLTCNFDLRFIGRNRNDIKDYFYQIFEYSLSQLIDVTYDTEYHVTQAES